MRVDSSFVSSNGRSMGRMRSRSASGACSSVCPGSGSSCPSSVCPAVNGLLSGSCSPSVFSWLSAGAGSNRALTSVSWSRVKVSRGSWLVTGCPLRSNPAKRAPASGVASRETSSPFGRIQLPGPCPFQVTVPGPSDRSSSFTSSGPLSRAWTGISPPVMSSRAAAAPDRNRFAIVRFIVLFRTPFLFLYQCQPAAFRLPGILKEKADWCLLSWHRHPHSFKGGRRKAARS